MTSTDETSWNTCLFSVFCLFLFWSASASLLLMSLSDLDGSNHCPSHLVSLPGPSRQASPPRPPQILLSPWHFWSQQPSRIKSSLKLSDLCQPLFSYCIWPTDSPLQRRVSTHLSLVTGWRVPLRGRCCSSEAVLPLSTQTHSVPQDQKSHISFTKSSFTILALTGCLRLWNSTQSFHKGKVTCRRWPK